MRCPIETPETEELLLAYCAGRLSPDTALLIEAHLETCPACRSFQESQQNVWEALDSWEPFPVSQNFDQQLYSRIADEGARSPWWIRLSRLFRPVNWQHGLPLAATACLLLLAGIILLQPHAGDSKVNNVDGRTRTVQAEQVEQNLNDLELLQEFKVVQPRSSGQMNSM